MKNDDQRRWQDIVERETLGEGVTDDDRDFRERHERDHPACARESEAWSQMLDALAAEGAAEGLARARGLAQRVLVQRDVERVAAVDVLHPRTVPIRRAASARAALVAGFAVAATAAAIVIGRGPEPEHAPAQATRGHTPETAAPDRAGARRPAVAPPTAPPTSPGPVGRLAMAGDGVRVDGGPTSAGVELQPGQVLDFAADSGREGAGACVVSHTPWIAACVSRSGRATFGAPLPARELVLERGRVAVTLDPLPAGQSFAVVTSKGSVAAIGTSFEVWIDEHGTVVASVLEGTIELRDALGSRRLHTGESGRLGEPDLARVEADALTWSRNQIAMARLWREEDAGLLRIRDEGPGDHASSITFDALPIGEAPLSMLAPPGAHMVAVAGSTESRSIDIEIDGTQDLSFEPPPASAGARGDRKRPAVPSAEELVRRAGEAWSAHRHREAARVLEQLIALYPDGPDAQNARVELADLLYGKLGNAKRALELYEAYLERGGPLGPEARYGRVRALQRLNRPRDERSAIEAFVAKHPTDWRCSELRERLAAL